MYGLILIASMGWTGGTAAGALAGLGLPETLTAAMGILLYGMFIAIIVPAARASRKDLIVICLAAVFSIGCKFIFPTLSSGFPIIISAVAAAVVGALLFPINLAETEAEEK